MPQHVFVETNWVVDYAAPAHNRVPTALRLVERAAAGDLMLYLPAICLREAENTIRRKFQPKPAKALREFRRWAREKGVLDAEASAAAVAFLDSFTTAVQNDLDSLSEHLAEIPGLPGVEVFALTEPMLERAISLRQEVADYLKPFDEAILAAVLERARVLQGEGVDEFSFVELDGDLRPWDRRGNARPELKKVFDDARIWVYGDYDLTSPAPPADWPPPLPAAEGAAADAEAGGDQPEAEGDAAS